MSSVAQTTHRWDRKHWFGSITAAFERRSQRHRAKHVQARLHTPHPWGAAFGGRSRTVSALILYTMEEMKTISSEKLEALASISSPASLYGLACSCTSRSPSRPFWT